MGNYITERNINMKTNVLKNAFILMERQHLKIGEIEKQLNVSTGYLSRLNKDDNTTKISLELVSSLADILSMPMDMLCNLDLSSLTPNELTAIHFIEKLTQDTIYGSQSWNKVTQKNINELGSGCCGIPGIPLFKHHEEGSSFDSFFAKESGTAIIGDFYYTNIDNKNWVYLICVRYPNDMKFNYEMYISIPYIDIDPDFGSRSFYKIHPVCASNSEEDFDLNLVIKKLYMTLVETNRHIQLTDDVKNVINNYLGFTTSQEEDEIPF